MQVQVVAAPFSDMTIVTVPAALAHALQVAVAPWFPLGEQDTATLAGKFAHARAFEPATAKNEATEQTPIEVKATPVEPEACNLILPVEPD